jgi:CheY-like chemotaxis protein
MGKMVEPNVLKQLQTSLRSYVLLYVEDNEKLNAQATVLFQKFFDTVISAEDGEKGLELFTLHRPEIVITNIEMPKMDGLTMAEAIHKIDHEVIIIVTSANDNFELLHRSIRIGVYEYLTKPLKIDTLIEAFTRCSQTLTEAFHRKVFNANLHAVFNYQNNLVLLLHERNVVMANQPCLDFFGTSSIETFRKQFMTFGEVLLSHNSFIYDHDDIKWFEHVSAHPGKLFNVKIADKKEEVHHFILSFQKIPEKEGYAVLSLNDVTELGLLKLYDSSALEREKLLKDEKMVLGLLEMAMRSAAKIKVYNFYKGLSIANDSLVVNIDGKIVKLKTPYVQLKAIQLSNDFYLTSELFPMAIAGAGIKKLDFEDQSIVFESYHLVQTSPTMRESIRVVPDQNIVVTVLYEGRKFDIDTEILDISIRGVRIQFPSLPSGFALKQTAVLDIVITMGPRPMIINTKAEVFHITEFNRRFEVVFLYELHGPSQKSMIDYIAKRQMILIREFKGMQNEE